MLNICIPMAGKGSRFVQAGYKNPKPFIDVNGAPMIQRVVENLTPYEPYRFIFIARREHEPFVEQHLSFANDVIYIDEVTEGAACTVLLARDYFGEEDSLLIANSDQIVRWNDAKMVIGIDGVHFKESNNVQDFINWCKFKPNCMGGIATFHSTHSKWSYALVDSDGYVTEVAEKKVISNHATVGVYYFDCASFFTKAADAMISKNIRVNGEFYVCPVFNELLGKTHYGIPELEIVSYEVSEMYGLGTPEDLEIYTHGS